MTMALLEQLNSAAMPSQYKLYFQTGTIMTSEITQPISSMVPLNSNIIGRHLSLGQAI